MESRYINFDKDNNFSVFEFQKNMGMDAYTMASVKSILIVDDNNINRRILNKILCEDYNIIEAEDGAVALSVLREYHETIAVVLLDIIMPVIDGYEVLRQMHKDPRLSKIPVIVASGQNSEDAEVKALSLGAIDYVLKPYKPEIIKHRISNTIYLRETASFVNSVQNDALTGLYGKEYFYIQVNEILQSNVDNQYDLICFDIERFKLVNDMYGMQVGDELLKHIGSILKKVIKDGYGICGRMGGDEFACLIPHREHYHSQIFKEMIAHVNGSFDLVKINLVLRYGIYYIDDTAIPVNIMCDRANLAKESIKGKYDTYFAYYDDTIRQKLLDEQMIVSDMKKAIKEKEFKIYFQPKYDLKTEEIIGAEALVRWMHTIKGLMYPGDFIPLFERNGFITDLDIYVWDQCCQNIRAWLDAGHVATPISVNVSRADIYNPNLPQILLSMIQKYEISPKYLHLEITETAYTQTPEQLVEAVLKLKKLGFIIEMDDFGTGYSSLNMLSELPIDVLKLDIRFIQKQEKKNTDNSVLSFIIGLAKWLDLKVVAEGVETEEQVQLLQSLNCDYAQGYYYAKPLPQDQFEQLLLQSEVQVLNRSGKGKQSAFSASKDRRQTMLVIDSESIDYSLLQKNYENEFHVKQVCSGDEALSFIDNTKEKIAVVMVSVSGQLSLELISEMLTVCQKANIPMIVLCDDGNRFENEIINMGISDYITRPYRLSHLTLRIQNAIAFIRLQKFEQEKELNSAIIEMRKRAEHDALTGLLNRAEFEVRIDNFFHKNNNATGIFIIFDVDNFKSINDTYGHVVGDRVLYVVGEMLHSIFHETEIIGRIGGDEFSLFIPYNIPLSQLQEKLNKICGQINLTAENIMLSCSAGVCFSPDYGVNYDELYENSDRALLTAKRHGKSKFVIFNQDIEKFTPFVVESKTICMLDNVSDATFVSDSITSQIIYINETAAAIIGKSKEDCIGKRCYELFWDQCRNCDRCEYINQHHDSFYEETTYLKDHQTPIHIKARVEEWDNRKVKVHYLRIGIKPEGNNPA